MTGAGFRLANLTNADFTYAVLTDADFRNAILTSTTFLSTTLTGADFTGANIRGANFNNSYSGTGLRLAQLYSTASYQAKDLSGIGLGGNNLASGNFAGQNLTGASFDYATTLTGTTSAQANLANAYFSGATPPAADFTGADTRGAQYIDLSRTTTTNLIWSDGHIHGLEVNSGGLLAVRDYDGNPLYAQSPIPITIDQHLAMGPGGTLRMVFEADAWGSTISFAPGIPVALGGVLNEPTP